MTSIGSSYPRPPWIVWRRRPPSASLVGFSLAPALKTAAIVSEMGSQTKVASAGRPSAARMSGRSSSFQSSSAGLAPGVVSRAYSARRPDEAVGSGVVVEHPPEGDRLGLGDLLDPGQPVAGVEGVGEPPVVLPDRAVVGEDPRLPSSGDRADLVARELGEAERRRIHRRARRPVERLAEVRAAERLDRRHRLLVPRHHRRLQPAPRVVVEDVEPVLRGDPDELLRGNLEPIVSDSRSSHLDT